MLPNCNSIGIEYIAGFVDGEGCISIRVVARARRAVNKAATIFLSIVNTNKAVLEDIQKFLECGTLRLLRQEAQYRENEKAVWQYNVFGGSAFLVIQKLLPFLRIKKRQAELALEFYSYRCRKTNDIGLRGFRRIPQHFLVQRDRVISEMRDLNRKGIAKQSLR